MGCLMAGEGKRSNHSPSPEKLLLTEGSPSIETSLCSAPMLITMILGTFVLHPSRMGESRSSD